MSPIESKLYEALRQEGLDPVPQFYIQGYYADFAFPDVRVAVEADGAVHNEVAHQQHDRKRDWILKRQGWTVKRFHGTTIYHKASNCAYVVRREVEGRRRQIVSLARERERRRQARRDAFLTPFRAFGRLFRRSRP